MIKANKEYLSKVANLSEEEIARLLSRMRVELLDGFNKEKLNSLKSIATQLEFEDVQLQQWRENRIKLFENFKNE